MRGYKWSEDENKILLEYYFNSPRDIIENLLPNRNWICIRLQARRLGLHRDSKLSKRDSNLTNLLSDTYTTFYWVGFLFADGYINHKRKGVKLQLSIKDSEHFHKFRNFIQMEHYHIDYYNGAESIGGTAQDIDNVPLLIEKFDFKPQKTFNPPNWKNYNFSNELIFCLLVGFFDGDGGMYHNKNCGKILIHSNWLNNLFFMKDFLEKFLNLSISQIPYISKSGYALWNLNTKLMYEMKIKATGYNLPLMDRKWGRIKI